MSIFKNVETFSLLLVFCLCNPFVVKTFLQDGKKVGVKEGHAIAAVVPKYFSLNKDFPLLLLATASGIFHLWEGTFTTLYCPPTQNAEALQKFPITLFAFIFKNNVTLMK